jgi:hypothetical protein
VTAADLFARAEAAKMSGDLDAEMNLRRMWMNVTNGLRQLEKDAPGISKDSGDSVPKRMMTQALLAYAGEIAALLSNLPERIWSLIPEIDEERRVRIGQELEEILLAAREVKVRAE